MRTAGVPARRELGEADRARRVQDEPRLALGHARRIATTFKVAPMAIQRQLRRLEGEGILVSRVVGNTRVFTWNPRSATVKNLRKFLEAELDPLPDDVTQQYFRQRQRPRRTSKAL